jgi:hypothetical protein
MLVPLDGTHYPRLIGRYLCVNEHGAAHVGLAHAEWLKSIDSHPIDNATRTLLRNGALARYFRALSATDLNSKSGLLGKQPVVFFFDDRITFTAALLQPDPVEH